LAKPAGFVEAFHRAYLLDILLMLTPLSIVLFDLLHSLPDVLVFGIQLESSQIGLSGC